MNNVWVSCDWHLWNRKDDPQHKFRSISDIGRLSDNFATDIQVDDIFIHLGDLCDPERTDVTKLKSIIQSIPGFKILCRGNHDTMDDEYYINLGFDVVTDVAKCHDIIFSHKPIRVNPDEINIHGHLHTQKLSTLGFNHINAYNSNYNDHPILVEELLDQSISQKPKDYIGSDLKHVKEKFEKYTSIDNYNTYTSVFDFTDKVAIYPVDECYLSSLSAETMSACDQINEIIFDDIADTRNWLADDDPEKQKKYTDNQEVIAEDSNNINLYCLSKQSDLDKRKLNPRIPNNFLVNNGYEDSKTPRVCFSTSIDGCLRALSQNLKDVELYVYRPIGKYTITTPSVAKVPDVNITQERWITKSIEIEKIGKIKVIKDSGDPGHKYKYGKHEAELYDWDWEWVDKLNENVILNHQDIYYNNEDAANLHNYTQDEKRATSEKYGLRVVGEYKETEDKNPPRTPEERAEERRKQREKALQKANKVKKKNARIRKLKKTFHIKDKPKNEDVGIDNIPGITDEKNFFDDYIAAFDFQNENHHLIQTVENIKFVDTINESAKDDKLYPVYIMLMHSGTALANAIKTVTQSHFSHSSVSFDSSMHKMYSFGRKADMNPFIGGFKREDIRAPFFQERDIPYALYVVPCTKSEVDLMRKRLDYFEKNKTKFKYDFTGLFKNYFGIADNPEYKWFCSRFVADIINSGRPSSDPYVIEPSIMKPEDFQNTNFAIYVTGGMLSTYDQLFVDRITNRILRAEKLRRAQEKQLESTNESTIYDLDPFNTYQDLALNYQLSMMDEAAFEGFYEYIKSFKVRFDKDGNPIISRREYDQLDQHFHQAVRNVKAYYKSGNYESMKEELCKVYYMIELINQYYLNPRVKSSSRTSADVKKEMLDLRSVMMNMFQQNLKLITIHEPKFNFQTYYDNSKYGKNTEVPKVLLSTISKTVVTLLK